MTPEEKREIGQYVMDMQSRTLSAVTQAVSIAMARLAWRSGQHEGLRGDLRDFLREFKPDKPDDPENRLMHQMIEHVLRGVLLRLSEIPDLENPPED